MLIDEQLVHLARYLGIDLFCQAILSNHVHLVLRSRQHVEPEWDDSEVARRCLRLCPERQQRVDKAAATPHDFAPLFERPGILVET